MSDAPTDAATDTAEDDLEATVTYRVRIDECGPDGRLRTSGLLRYGQDAAWIHSERLGFDRHWYASRGLAWLVRSADIRAIGDVSTGETISVTTRVVGFRRVTARRRTTFTTRGEPVAEVLTDWVMTDARGLPARVPPDFERFVAGPLEPYSPAKVILGAAPDGAALSRLVVRRQDLDPMDHVNNAAWVDYVEEVVAAIPTAAAVLDSRPLRLVVEYARPGSLGEQIDARCWPLAARWAVHLTGADGVDLARAIVEG